MQLGFNGCNRVCPEHTAMCGSKLNDSCMQTRFHRWNRWNRNGRERKRKRYGKKEIIRDLTSDPRSRCVASRSHDQRSRRTQRANSFLPMASIRFVISSVSPLHSNLKDQETWKRSRCYSFKRPSTEMRRHGFNHVRIHYNKPRIAILNLLIYSSRALLYCY